jgi:ketosteroid isomerase-like protein
MSTKEVLERHLKCLSAGDFAGFLAGYAPDAVVFRPVGFAGAGGIVKGLAEFGPAFSALFKEFARPNIYRAVTGMPFAEGHASPGAGA